MFWDILKIRPTADRKEIRDAYRALLSETNPEDKPEEFKQLREAYEEARAYAEAQAAGVRKTPMELWEDELSALYDDFHARLDVTGWQKLLNEDICLSVDTRMRCEDILLRFLMDHFLLPQEVWRYLDSQFSWSQRPEELYETYPRDFIDYAVLNGIHLPEMLPLKLFVPGKDGELCGRYISLYRAVQSAENEEEADKAAAEMLSLGEQHPYGTARVLSIRLDRGEREALRELEELQKKYPEDMRIGTLLVRYLYENEEIAKCRALIEELKKTDADDIDLRWYDADCLAAEGKHQDAVKVIDALLRDTTGNGQLQYELDRKRSEMNKTIITELNEKLREDPDDLTAAVDLAWAYLENDMFEEASQLAGRLPEDYEDRFGYYNLKGTIAAASGRYEEALPLLIKLAETAEALPEDTELNRIRHGRTGESLLRVGHCYQNLGDLDHAEEAYEKALVTKQGQADALRRLAGLALRRRQYEKAAEYASRLVREYPANYQGYLTLAYSYFYAQKDRDAYNAVEHALDLYRSDLSAYTLKARILIRNGAADGAREILDFLKESGVGDDPSVMYVRGALKEDAEDDAAGAEELYEKALSLLEGNEAEYEYGAALVYRLLCLKGDHLNGNKEEDREVMLELAERGLKCAPDHYGLRDYKAWLLVKAKRYDEAMDLLRQLLEVPHHSPSVEAQIGQIYYRDLAKNADKALEYYERSLERGGSISGHFYAGMCCLYMHRFEDAEKHFLTLREKNPESVDAPYRLSFVYGMQNRLEEALAEAESVIALVKDRDSDESQYYIRKAVLLRKLDMIDEAVETVREAMEKYGYSGGNRMIFQIYAHAGRLKDAEAHLKAWNEADSTDSDLCDCGILLHMYKNDFAGALLEKKLVAKHLSRDRALEVDQIIAEYYGDYKKQLEKLLKWYDCRMENGGYDLSRIQGEIAFCYFRLGDRNNAVKYAEAAMTEIETKLHEFETDKLLFMARKIRLLALLGKKEEAYALIEACRTMPFCESCPERHCKDVDIFRMQAEEIFGNYRKAYEIARECRGIYPDEEDFIIAEHLLKRKVK